MLRNTLLWASTNPFLAEKLPTYRFVQKATRRFMPGEDFASAVAEGERLAGLGIAATTTLLGENLKSLQEADGVVEHYQEDLRVIEERKLDMEISVKPTQIGLDYGVEEARKRLAQLASSTSDLVWVDMEGSAYVDRTLEVFRAVKQEHGNVGLCLQSYLHRTADDLESLLPLDPAIRLVKGAYNEPPSVAFPSKSDVDRSLRARAREGPLRIRDALRHPAGRAGATRAHGAPGAGPDQLWIGVVSVVHAPSRRAPRESLVRREAAGRLIVGHRG